MSELKNRREFLKQSASAGLGIGLAGGVAPVHGWGIYDRGVPSDRVNVAVMGVNSRGHQLAMSFALVEGAEVTHIVDVDRRAVERTVADVAEVQDRRPEGITDFRRALDDSNVDALVIATPDHWHAPAGLLALEAGKHVYVEKPCCHSPREGELFVEAQERHDLVVQMGDQRRSLGKVIEAMELLHSGEIGAVRNARCWYSRNRQPISMTPEPEAVPEWLDWELWQGPAPRKDFQETWVHYNWHWFWNWGTGESGNNAVHQLDVARWGMQADYPEMVNASGGTHVHEHWHTPDNQMLSFEFEDDKLITWEGISYNSAKSHGGYNGVVFHGEDGSLVITGTRDAYTLFDAEGNEVEEVLGDRERESPEEEGPESLAGPQAYVDSLHVQNFLAAIQEGAQPNADIVEGYKSTLMCLLGNISHRTGRTLHCNPENGHILADEKAMQLWSREYAPGWEPKV